MKAIMVMFDSLNRHMLGPYGCDWVKTPNFDRLTEKSVMFTNSFVGSMPCIPARRELHTGRLNFLHRSWGPLEPFDDSMPEILKNNGIYTHLVTDHLHYFSEGGCTYHPRYSSWRMSRGQVGDPWIAQIENHDIPENLNNWQENLWRTQNWINRKYAPNIADQPQAKTFRMGLEFLETNYKADNWLLTIETFDPHEPYYSDQKYKDLYPHDYDGPTFDWPPYEPISQSPEQVNHMKMEKAALISMCDEHLGKVLDFMDSNDMWQDTMLIVNTDHGFLLGEHDSWAKCWCPWYNEIAHTPLFIWDPRSGRKKEKCPELVQTIDLAPTILEYFNQPIPKDMQGFPLRDTIANDTPIRNALIFGMHGAHVNCTDGRYVYMRGPANDDNQPLYDYTLMPTHMRNFFSPEELDNILLAEPFTFTKGCRTMKIHNKRFATPKKPFKTMLFDTMLFDLENDPGQLKPIENKQVEEAMIKQMTELMRQNDCPAEQFQRLGLK